MGLEVEILEHYLEVAFLSPADLMSVVIAFGIGVAIFVVGMKTGAFHAHFPVWMSIDWYYERFVVGAGRVFVAIDDAYEAWRAAVSRSLRWVNTRYHAAWTQSSRMRERFVTTVLTGSPRAEEPAPRAARLRRARARAAGDRALRGVVALHQAGGTPA